MDDDDDIFLYGESSANDREPTKVEVPTSVPKPVPLETVKAASNGLVENLEAKAEEEIPFGSATPPEQTNGDYSGENGQNGQNGQNGYDEQDEDDNGGEDEDSDEDDIEIIMDQPSRSLDLRPNRPPPTTSRALNASQATPIKPAQPTLTTEYTPRERGAPAPSRPQQSPLTGSTSQAQAPQPQSHLGQQASEQTQSDDGPDPSTLPPVSAAPSHPIINPNMIGMADGRSILEYDLTAMGEKPWRRPGSDISDWFNYGFDEMSWEAYCYRRRDLGELADVLKTNVLNFAGMPEDQLTALPPELRTMVMTGANAMMNNASANNMMGPGVGMNPMMDMSGMGGMNMGPMGMGMNGDMGMQGPMMPDGSGGPQGTGTPEQGGQMGMQDGYGGGGPGPGMMGMGMNNEFGMQDQGQMGQGMYPGMEGSNTPNPPQQHQQTPVPSVPPQNVPPGPGSRGTPQGQYRGRVVSNQRGRGAFAGRGRGRYGDGPAVPVRSTSPLPPNVPTGPRNANRYKDRDNNAPAVDGLDYGGGKDSGRRTPSGEPEERSSRKRRISPGPDDGRGSKRR
ncbi:hypothetical protein CONPUDRAFT_161755 [Coniophora puteana RWD-64-598 SS2]|uniref:Pre-mRNA polyadenylation factor Fip1 domain-containing protein n=1 Tax=Coniophora puteana (strain RWD-64-598) TaxID=741705 RepID=A0A5M3N8G3_CONPW|nr:uncharacterized protein CONPUDRAFT_161755 [Coniophora puteana RWD-64-598 SS2]EIW87151.1 hypothetical protein CONPUDRAFT_161755 [Coniophora puteana RWD-64-598 SS2]